MAFGSAFAATSEQDARWNEWRTTYRDITPDDLRTAGAQAPDAARFALPLNVAMKRFGISNTARQAAFLANVAQETGDPLHGGIMLRAIEESSVPYTINIMCKVFPRRFPDDASIVAVLREPGDIDHRDKRRVAHPVKFFNHVYGHRKDLGNRPDSNDGFDYRGRGVLGLTGRGRYVACGLALGLDFAGNPDMVAQPFYGCLAGAWAWSEAAFSKAGDEKTQRNLNLIADLDTPEAFDRTCAGVNHGDVDALKRGIRIGGLDLRRKYWPMFHHALHLRDMRLFHGRMQGVQARVDGFDGWMRPTVNDEAVRGRFLRNATPTRGVPR